MCFADLTGRGHPGASGRRMSRRPNPVWDRGVAADSVPHRRALDCATPHFRQAAGRSDHISVSHLKPAQCQLNQLLTRPLRLLGRRSRSPARTFRCPVGVDLLANRSQTGLPVRPPYPQDGFRARLTATAAPDRLILFCLEMPRIKT